MRNDYITWAEQTAELIEYDNGEGSFFTSQGNRIFDFLSTSFHNSFGHQPKEIIEAIRSAPFYNGGAKFDYPLRRKVSSDLIKLLNREGALFYTVSGAESVENALKFARQQMNNPLVVATSHSYHGASLGALSVTGDWRNKAHITVDSWTKRIPRPSEDPEGKALKQAFKDSWPSALIVETVTAANGVYSLPPLWQKALKELKKEKPFFLILDEVVCGFFRTGTAFGFHQLEIEPDIVCLGKAISGGVIPFGAVWTSPEIFHHYDHQVLAQGLTHYATPLGLAALEAVLQIIQKPSFQKNLAELESIAQKHLSSFTVPTRQHGLLMAIDIKAPPLSEFIKEGIYIGRFENYIVLAPPLTTQPEDLDRAFGGLKRILGVKRG